MSFLDDVEKVAVKFKDPGLEERIGNIAIKQADEAMNVFQRIRNELTSRNILNDGTMSPPPYEEMLMDDAHWNEIEYVYKIINKYRDMDYDGHLTEINQDLVKLSAGVIRLSTVVGYAKGIASNAESNRKLVQAKLHIQIREIAEELNLKITETAAESMSRAEAKDLQRYASISGITQEMLQALYFASLAFVRVLEGAAQRLYHESRRSID